MKKTILWFFIILMLILAVLLAVAGIVYYRYTESYAQAENTMPRDGVLVLTQQQDGRVALSWPEGENAQQYIVAVTDEQQTVLFHEIFTDARSCILPALPQDQLVTLHVGTAAQYQIHAQTRTRLGEHTLQVTTRAQAPAVQELKTAVDSQQSAVEITFSMGENEVCRMYLQGEQTPYRTLETGSIRLTFGENGDFPMLSYDESRSFTFEVYRQEPGLVYYGLPQGSVSVVREDFLGTVLTLERVNRGNNVYTLRWNETKGDRYEVQRYDKKTDSWITVHTVARDEKREYTTGHLERFLSYKFRVVALGGQTLPDSQFAATPDETSMTTGATAVYCTIWPLIDLNVYSDTARTTKLGTVSAGKAFCVLDHKGDYFQIRYGKSTGYINANYCMINLPEYMGDLCAYKITNSRSSAYMVHEYGIPQVTDTVIKGYENVRYDGKYLVPLLYPTAQKLVDAALAARNQGYRLKIYDTFRPRTATLSIYDLTAAILNNPIPEKTFTGAVLTDLPQLSEGEILTYKYLMTDGGRYSLANFLAKGASNHNLGVALDLTLESLKTGKEIPMQTAIHDLSWYSEVERNNKNAKLLASIMTGAGFGTLKSEWWHFQDNEAKKKFDLAVLASGVSAECWMADDHGMRYRRASGRYYKDCTVKIGGTSYTFDENGYVVNP